MAPQLRPTRVLPKPSAPAQRFLAGRCRLAGALLPWWRLRPRTGWRRRGPRHPGRITAAAARGNGSLARPEAGADRRPAAESSSAHCRHRAVAAAPHRGGLRATGATPLLACSRIQAQAAPPGCNWAAKPHPGRRLSQWPAALLAGLGTPGTRCSRRASWRCRPAVSRCTGRWPHGVSGQCPAGCAGPSSRLSTCAPWAATGWCCRAARCPRSPLSTLRRGPGNRAAAASGWATACALRGRGQCRPRAGRPHCPIF